MIVEVLNPRSGPVYGASENNGSMVLRLTYGSISFLLTSNIEAKTEAFCKSEKPGYRARC